MLAEYFESAGFHASEHVHDSGLYRDRFLPGAFDVVAEFVEKV
jgi:hypothetical protein